MVDDEVIRGKLVVLRHKRLTDAEDDYTWRVDEELSELDATLPIRMSFEQFLRYFREEVEFSQPWSKRLAFDTLEGCHIGNCMYYDIDLTRGCTELGIMIGAKNYWNQGYGEDAVTSLVEHIFQTTSLQLIYLHTLQWNQRARRSFSKSGFCEVGQKQRGRYDFIRMEITREEWLERTVAQ